MRAAVITLSVLLAIFILGAAGLAVYTFFIRKSGVGEEQEEQEEQEDNVDSGSTAELERQKQEVKRLNGEVSMLRGKVKADAESIRKITDAKKEADRKLIACEGKKRTCDDSLSTANKTISTMRDTWTPPEKERKLKRESTYLQWTIAIIAIVFGVVVVGAIVFYKKSKGTTSPSSAKRPTRIRAFMNYIRVQGNEPTNTNTLDKDDDTSIPSTLNLDLDNSSDVGEFNPDRFDDEKLGKGSDDGTSKQSNSVNFYKDTEGNIAADL